MATFKLDKSFVNKSIKTASYDLRFRYNTNKDYFYFDVVNLFGDIITLHNKVVTGYDFGGFNFLSNADDSYATASNIENFRLNTDG